MDALDRRNLLAAAGMMGVAAVSKGAHAGPLNPPSGAITSTSKALSEVEPRLLLNSSTAASDASNVYIVSARGSYYLTENLIVPSGKNGISIFADHVTIDLNGFAILGNTGSLKGVTAPNFVGGQTHIVRNGAIKRMGGDGLSMLSAQGSIIEDITVQDCTGIGLAIGGAQTRVARCSAFRNGGGGFSVSADGVMVDCISEFNAGPGFVCIAPLLFERCSSINDTGGGFSLSLATLRGCQVTGSGVGFSFTSGLTAVDCRATGNTAGFFSNWTGTQASLSNCRAASCVQGFQITGANGRVSIESCQANECTGAGFNLADGATIIDSSATNNAGAGITIVNNGVIRRCTLAGNTAQYAVSATNGAVIDSCHFTNNAVGGLLCGANNSITNCTFFAHVGGGAAVRCTSSGNAIDNCQFNANVTAISVAFGGCTITRNRLAGNTTKYSLSGTNFVGPSITTAAGMATAPAWANIEF